MPVTIQQLHDHLRLESDQIEEDRLLDTYLQAAIEKASVHTGLAVKRESQKTHFSEFSCRMELKGPSPENICVHYMDQNGQTQVLDTQSYYVVEEASPPFISVDKSVSLPSILRHPAPIWVTYEAGYTQENVPFRLKAAILLIAAHFYEIRESVIVGTVATEVPMGAMDLLSTLVVDFV